MLTKADINMSSQSRPLPYRPDLNPLAAIAYCSVSEESIRLFLLSDPPGVTDQNSLPRIGRAAGTSISDPAASGTRQESAQRRGVVHQPDCDGDRLRASESPGASHAPRARRFAQSAARDDSLMPCASAAYGLPDCSLLSEEALLCPNVRDGGARVTLPFIHQSVCMRCASR